MDQHTDLGLAGRRENAARSEALGFVPLSEGEDGRLKSTEQSFL